MPRRPYKRGKARQKRSDSMDTDEVHSATSHCFSTISRETTATSPDPSQSESMDTPDLTPGRRFYPYNAYPGHFSLEDIEAPQGDVVHLACPVAEEKCPHCNKYEAHHGTLVVAIDGACSNNGRNGARGAIGVFCGYGSDFNDWYTLPTSFRHTSQVAELCACYKALFNVRNIQRKWKEEGKKLNAVVIKSDSEYVVRGITEWLPKWKSNGWKNAKGLPVANENWFREIEVTVLQLERDNVCVKFWHVPRESNKIADAMAKCALQEDLKE